MTKTEASPSPDIVGLLERVEAATGPDRELDYELALYEKAPDWRKRKPWKQTNGWAKPDVASTSWAVLFYDGGGNALPVPQYTASLDAALALCERVLPGWVVQLETWRDPAATARLAEWNIGEAEHEGHARTLPLALLAALLRALLETTK
jgi:hypothetical protein